MCRPCVECRQFLVSGGNGGGFFLHRLLFQGRGLSISIGMKGRHERAVILFELGFVNRKPFWYSENVKGVPNGLWFFLGVVGVARRCAARKETPRRRIQLD